MEALTHMMAVPLLVNRNYISPAILSSTILFLKTLQHAKAFVVMEDWYLVKFVMTVLPTITLVASQIAQDLYQDFHVLEVLL